MRRVSLVGVLLAACGGGGGAPVDSAPDVQQARCDPAKPFNPPVRADELSTDAEDGCARLTADELDINFCRRSAGSNFDIWTAHRASRDLPFETPTLLTSANSVSNDIWPTQAPDGLTLINDADRTTPGTYRMWASKRASIDQPFSAPALISELMPTDQHGYLANEHALYFSSLNRVGEGKSDLWHADYNEALGTLGTPAQIVGDINTEEDEVTPVLTADERFIYFRRTTTTPNADPMLPPTVEVDVWTAARSTPQDGFGTSSKVAGLDMAMVSETPTWVSADNCVIYVQIAVPNSTTMLDIWRAERPL